jgi:N-carbamoyl-L-amino-acid hydrolase
MMGSLVHAGGLAVEEALSATDAAGISLGQELSRIGYAGTVPCGQIKPHQFIELHIEQGPVLERMNIPIGVVENLQGISWTELTITGQANHAGTTPMSMRSDAGYGASAIAVAVRGIAEEIGGTQVATVGKTDLFPNVINVVPGKALLTVDLRNTDDGLLCRAETLLENCVDKLAKNEGLVINSRRLARFEPVAFDPMIASVIESHTKQLDLSSIRMTSGAGHDAQMMARVCPSAMIFVPSVGGISHNPAERTDAVHLEGGANVLLNVMFELAQIG